MKKIIVVVVSAMFAGALLFVPTASHAVDAKLGINMMGDWWKPAFLPFLQEESAKLMGSNMEDELDGSFMFGPMFWVNVASGWNIGGQMLFGLSRNKFEYTSLALDADLLRWLSPGWGGLLGGYFDIGESKCRRYDLDLYAEHPVHKYVDLTIGIRFNYDDGEGDSFRFGTPWFDMKKEEYSAWYFGPSIGAQFHYEFVEGLVLSTGAALTFQFGEFDSERRYLDSFWTLVPYEYTAGYVCIGFDMNLKLSYYIKPAHLEVFAGGRYQVLPHIAASDDSPVYDLTYKNGWINGEVEHWGGIFFGAAYRFR